MTFVSPRNPTEVLDALRFGSKGADTVVPFIEQGTVPVLHTLCASENAITQECAKEILAWLKGHVTGAMQVLLRMLKMSGNFALRSNVGVALVHLCLGSSILKRKFLDGGGLEAVLTMLRSGADAYAAAMEVLLALEPLIKAEEEAKRAAHMAKILATESGQSAKDNRKEEGGKDSRERNLHSGLISEANFNNPGTCDVIFNLIENTGEGEDRSRQVSLDP